MPTKMKPKARKAAKTVKKVVAKKVAAVTAMKPSALLAKMKKELAAKVKSMKIEVKAQVEQAQKLAYAKGYNEAMKAAQKCMTDCNRAMSKLDKSPKPATKAKKSKKPAVASKVKAKKVVVSRAKKAAIISIAPSTSGPQ